MAQLSNHGGAATNQEIENVQRIRIVVSSTKTPLFYVNLAKWLMQQQNDEVEFSTWGKSFGIFLTALESLTSSGLAIVKDIYSSMVDIRDEARGGIAQRVKYDFVLKKSERFNELMAAANDEKGTADQCEE